MKAKLFTHTDLDGVGCAIVASRMVNLVADTDVTYCDYHEIDDEVKSFIESGEYKEYDQTFITDISVNEEVAGMIEEVNEEYGYFHLIDHHGTALWMNKYRWAHVKTKDVKGKTSGTSLFYEFLGPIGLEEEYLDLKRKLDAFTEKVRRYDTWEWITKYDDPEAKELNDLLYILGRDRFVDRFTYNLELDFTSAEQLLLDLEQERIDAYVKRKAETIKDVMFGGYLIGAVYADQYQSELGNRLNVMYPEYSAIAMINPDRSGSLRTIHDEVDVSALAKRLGGGGHPKAAGFPMPDNDHLELIFFEEDE